jgi:hypothetical protein
MVFWDERALPPGVRVRENGRHWRTRREYGGLKIYTSVYPYLPVYITRLAELFEVLCLQQNKAVNGFFGRFLPAGAVNLVAARRGQGFVSFLQACMTLAGCSAGLCDHDGAP